MLTQYREWTVGPLNSATRRPIITQFIGCHHQAPVQGFYRQKMQLTYWHKGNEMRDAACVDTQTSIEWLYCLYSLYCDVML